MERRYYTGRNVRRALSIEELRRMARRRVPHFVFEYVDGGAEEEITLRRNRAVLEDIRFVPRTLVDVSARHQLRTLFGREMSSPLVIAPTGYNGMLSHRADVALGRAAAAAGIPFTLSTASTAKLEEVAEEAPGRLWMQLYLMRDRDFARRLVQRADAAGYEALVVTTDAVVLGSREWDRRSFARPLQLTLRCRLETLLHPRWFFDVLVPYGLPRLANLEEALPGGASNVKGGAGYLAKEMAPDLDWDDIRRLRELWPRTFIVKGILRVEDAVLAVEAGADGIVLSNHGGRQLDGAVSAIEVLPEVTAEVGGRTTILVDGGFRRGADVVKALALGAGAVMVGRAPLYGVAAGGEAGAARALEILSTEIDRVLGMLGCPCLDALEPTCLR